MNYRKISLCENTLEEVTVDFGSFTIIDGSIWKVYDNTGNVLCGTVNNNPVLSDPTHFAISTVESCLDCCPTREVTESTIIVTTCDDNITVFNKLIS